MTKRNLADPAYEPSDADFAELLKNAFEEIATKPPNLVRTPSVSEAESVRAERQAQIAELQKHAFAHVAAYRAKKAQGA
jgi:preprotein translocase subunit SecA